MKLEYKAHGDGAIEAIGNGVAIMLMLIGAGVRSLLEAVAIVVVVVVVAALALLVSPILLVMWIANRCKGKETADSGGQAQEEAQ